MYIRAERRALRSLAIALCACSTVTLCACRPTQADIEKRPAHQITWAGKGGGFQIWGSGGNFLYAVSVEPRVFEVWQWKGGGLERLEQLTVPASLNVVWLGNNRYLLTPIGEAYRDNPLITKDATTGTVLQKCPLGGEWYCSKVGLSGNGRYSAISVVEDTGRPAADIFRPRLRVGLIKPESKEICWPATLVGNTTPSHSRIRQIIPSDDGAYVALACWGNGAAVVDVSEQKVLWEVVPKDAVSLVDIAFSPDNKLVYTGGGAGCVYGMEVQTGKIVSQWFATETGKSIYGHRISTVAVSPDGRFVAAGTGPMGLVYLWSAQTGRRLKVFNHGGSTILILSFSPDSKALATVASGMIKVWRLPEDGEDN